MSRKVKKIPQTRQYIPIEDQRLRVAAYCRVSTRHEEQCHSLNAQIAYYYRLHRTQPKLGICCCVFGYCIRRPYSKPPWLSAAFERLCQKKNRLDFGEVSQPVWSGRTGNDPAGQEAQESKHRNLH